ncbi:ABC transporter permease [Paracidobacterium acidisoli]|uniref:ABC transporter permease n=1 Tax=Paracidobacterium acidisoli TaxID=2303751 RepID=A0A372IRE3_9BACT|nr:ABC transporter permease [Paracidobacterium acidisoli]MBT9330374.1 ABC transporter permease [Paracidobacterium acidisoli]
MIEHFFHTEIARGLVECAITALLGLVVMLLARRRAPDLFRDLPVAELRGVLQIVAVGAILAFLLHGPRWTSIFVLAGMVFAAAGIVRKRARLIPRAFRLALTAIAAGAGGVLCLMALLGVIPLGITILIPVGSMVIANTMNTQSLFLDRLRGEVLAHTGEIESALALGATAEAALSPSLSAAYRACLIPSIDNIRSLGIVWIPGIMAGMVLSGASPLYAALYQFVVITTIFSASALTCLIASRMVTRRLFSAHEQLLLRP